MKDLNAFKGGLGDSFKEKICFPSVKPTLEPARELHKKEKDKGFGMGD